MESVVHLGDHVDLVGEGRPRLLKALGQEGQFFPAAMGGGRVGREWGSERRGRVRVKKAGPAIYGTHLYSRVTGGPKVKSCTTWETLVRVGFKLWYLLRASMWKFPGTRFTSRKPLRRQPGCSASAKSVRSIFSRCSGADEATLACRSSVRSMYEVSASTVLSGEWGVANAH